MPVEPPALDPPAIFALLDAHGLDLWVICQEVGALKLRRLSPSLANLLSGDAAGDKLLTFLLTP
jgi:hypothetical protein